ncbi:protein kinase [Streptomyces sp. NPDC101118]|uniref:protein kinase domain-containing protein n=1 Tax=Streptomyces sp. NPDC101118 TaxID=3366109 RepID=UPI0038306263
MAGASTEQGAATTGGAGTPLLPDDPQRVGGYWLASRLGAGGQGVVYEAYDADGARVALKVLHREADPFVRERFAKEAEAARRVAPFCTARILDAAVDGDSPYLVSEYVAGPTLAGRVRAHGPLSEDAALRLATGAATALAAIHHAGVIHRDLKPGNVLLGPDGPRIIDFGIARAPDMSLTATGAIMGTLGYMAPEVLMGQRATTAADVFAWAAVVLYAATGAEPFRGDNWAEVTHRTASVDPDLSGVPARLRPLIAAALAKDPALRPGAPDLLAGLIAAATGEAAVAGPAAPAGPVSPAGPVGPTGPAGPATQTPTVPADPRVADPRVALPRQQAADPRLDLLRAGARQADEAPHQPTEAVPPLGDRAEAAYAALAPDAQLAAHDLLLRLVVPGTAPDGSQDTVRTVTPAELFGGRPESEQRATARAAEALTAAGALVTEADGSVRPVSTALLPAWRRLRTWTDADRTGIAYRQRVTWAVHRWDAHGKRSEDLLTGTELRTLLDWLPTAAPQLRPSPPELAFLEASRAAATRAVRRRRQLLSGLAAVTVIALLAGGVAYLQNREADLRAAQATARSVAQAADSLRGTEPDTAMLLGLAAYRISPVPEARAALFAAAAQRERSAVPLPDVNDGDTAGRVLTPDGRRVFAYSPLGVSMWNLAKGTAGAARPELTFPVKAAELGVDPPKMSPDGTVVAIQRKDDTVLLVSTRDGKPLGPPVQLRDDLVPQSVTNKGQVTVYSNRVDEAYRVIDRTGKELTTLARGESVSPDGDHTVTCPDGTPIRVYRFGTARTVVAPSDGGDIGRQCKDTEFSPDGRLVLMRSTGGATFVYDVRGGRQVGHLDSEESDLHFSSGGRYLVGETDDESPYPGMLEIWKVGDAKKPLVRIPTGARQDTSGDDIGTVVLDESAKTLRYESRNADQVQSVDVSAVLAAASDDTDAKGVAISPDGRTAVIGSTRLTDHPIQLLDLRTGKRVAAPVTQHSIEAQDSRPKSALSSDGRFLAYTDETQTRREIVVRETATGKETGRLTAPAGNRIMHLAISPDAGHVALTGYPAGVPTGEGYTTQVWETGSRKLVHTFTGTEGLGTFSPDSRRLLTTAGEELDLRTGKTRKGVFGSARNSQLAFAPDGTSLALLRQSGWIEIWDGDARTRKALLPSGLVRGGERYGQLTDWLSYSADGKQLALVVNGDSVQLWDVGSRLALGKPLNVTGRQIDAMSFDGDALRAVSGAQVHTFDLDPGSLAEQICRKVGRDITEAEWQTYIPDAPYRGLC